MQFVFDRTSVMKLIIFIGSLVATFGTLAYSLYLEESSLETVENSLEEETNQDVAKRGEAIPAEVVDVFKKGSNIKVPIQKSSLFAHNKVRAFHGVPALVWNWTLAATAQQHAHDCATSGKLIHSTGSGYGENIGGKSISIQGTVYTPAIVVYAWWYETISENYIYDAEPSSTGAGHFTQVVWAGTTSVGCGASHFYGPKYGYMMETTYVVCQYYPPGNYRGQYVANVKPPVAGETPPASFSDLEEEGCVDYVAKCGGYKSMCPNYSFLKEPCCDTCSS